MLKSSIKNLAAYIKWGDWDLDRIASECSNGRFKTFESLPERDVATQMMLQYARMWFDYIQKNKKR